MAMEPDEDMPAEKMSKDKSQRYEKSHPYEKVIWWIILAVAILLIILLYSCRIVIT